MHTLLLSLLLLMITIIMTLTTIKIKHYQYAQDNRTPNTHTEQSPIQQGAETYEECNRGHGVIERGHEWYKGDTH